MIPRKPLVAVTLAIATTSLALVACATPPTMTEGNGDAAGSTADNTKSSNGAEASPPTKSTTPAPATPAAATPPAPAPPPIPVANGAPVPIDAGAPACVGCPAGYTCSAGQCVLPPGSKGTGSNSTCFDQCIANTDPWAAAYVQCTSLNCTGLGACDDQCFNQMCGGFEQECDSALQLCDQQCP